MGIANDKRFHYCAVFGDIIGSRQIFERNGLQKELLSALELVNSSFSEKIIAPFRFIAGDEVRGLLQDESESYNIIRLFQATIHPHKMRFAVGVGDVNTDLSSDIAAVDGKALHNASLAMELLKSRRRSLGRSIYFLSENTDWDNTVNAITFLVDSIRSSWTASMLEKAELISAGLTQLEVGDRLGISHQAVGKSMLNAKYYALAEGEQLINTFLQCNQ